MFPPSASVASISTQLLCGIPARINASDERVFTIRLPGTVVRYFTDTWLASMSPARSSPARLPMVFPAKVPSALKAALAVVWLKFSALPIAKVTRDDIEAVRDALDESIARHRRTEGKEGRRDTGITWLALAGIDVAKIQRRAGHDKITTAIGYVKTAEDVSGAIGEPFPALPSVPLSPEAIDVAKAVEWTSDWTRKRYRPLDAAKEAGSGASH